MAWSWSHTQEAYDAAKANCYALDHETLTVIWAEWRAYAHQSGVGSFDADNYQRALNSGGKLPTDVLAQEVWEKAEAQATCDNGGWNAWLCPYGCGPHCVPFTKEDE